MDSQHLKKLFELYENGQANETERALVEAWYRSYQNNEATIITKTEAEKAKAMRAHVFKATSPKLKLIHQPWFRVAAILCIIIGAGLFGRGIYARYAETVAISGTPELKLVDLPDGSKVWLNSATRLRYPQQFNGKQREVVLEEGEAFFKVKKDAKHPFIVKAPQFNVKVLGTSFNIKAYKALHISSVAVATGRVAVSNANGQLAILTPGLELDLENLSKHFTVRSIDPDQAQGWKNGETYLHDADMDELTLALKNIYGLTVRAGSPQMAKYRFSLKLVHNLPPQQIIELIGQLHQTNFRKEGDDIVLY